MQFSTCECTDVNPRMLNPWPVTMFALLQKEQMCNSAFVVGLVLHVAAASKFWLDHLDPHTHGEGSHQSEAERWEMDHCRGENWDVVFAAETALQPSAN